MPSFTHCTFSLLLTDSPLACLLLHCLFLSPCSHRLVLLPLHRNGTLLSMFNFNLPHSYQLLFRISFPGILCKSHVPILFLLFPSLPTSPPATRVVVDTPRCCLNLGPQARLGIQSLSLVLSLDLPLQRFDVDTAEPPSPTSFPICLLRLSSLVSRLL